MKTPLEKESLTQLTKSSENLQSASQVVSAVVEEKDILKSKTFWTSIILAIAPAIPPVGAAVAANPELAGVLVGLVMGVLRMVSDTKVKIK